MVKALAIALGAVALIVVAAHIIRARPWRRYPDAAERMRRSARRHQ